MYDVIIVGAGAAGASAALELSRKTDLKILVLEKASLPREKPCGGAMPSSVEKLLDLDLSPIVKNRTKQLKLYYDYRDEVLRQTLDSNAPILINRSEFDMFVLKKALLTSPEKIELQDNTGVQHIKEKENYVHIVLENGKELKSSYLIAADGALGKTASMAGLMKKRKFAQSFDAEIMTIEDYYDEHADTMVMNYFCLPNGYAWIFPKEKNRFSCGVGTWGRPINAKKALNNFIENSFSRSVIYNIQISGYPIPVYPGRQKIATNRILLTGDAAALVDPVTGEGIRHALHSGKIAGEVIENVMAGKIKIEVVSETYQKMIHKGIGKELNFKLSFAVLAFHHAPEMFYKTFAKDHK